MAKQPFEDLSPISPVQKGDFPLQMLLFRGNYPHFVPRLLQFLQHALCQLSSCAAQIIASWRDADLL